MVGSDQVGRTRLEGEGSSRGERVAAHPVRAASPQETLGQGQVPGLSFQLCVVSTDWLEAKMSTVRWAFPVLLLKTHLPCAEASVPKRGDNPTLLFSKALRSVHT